jgi:hypothetical protein
MRAFGSVILVLLLTCITSDAADYVRIGVDSIPAGATNFEIPFYVEHTCPDPTRIGGISHGFVLTATGDAGWSFAGYDYYPAACDWFPLSCLLFHNAVDGTAPDSFAVGGSDFGLGYGMPYLLDSWLFSLYLDIGPGEGEILIDSAFVFDASAWKWSEMTCGQGGAPDRPLFLDENGSDASHPIHITVYEPICGDADLSGQVDIDDAVYVISYIFMFGPAPNPLSVGDCDCSGGPVPVDIDDVVYLMDYILRGGPEPCDIDSDGIPDC